jgi:hypothetical protein
VQTRSARAKRNARLRRTHEIDRDRRELETIECFVVFFGEIFFDLSRNFDLRHASF